VRSGAPVERHLRGRALFGFAQVETGNILELCSVPHREFVLARRNVLERFLDVPLELKS